MGCSWELFFWGGDALGVVFSTFFSFTGKAVSLSLSADEGPGTVGRDLSTC